jgi:hypothetical protein
MTTHTELPDERVAGFLHLHLREPSSVEPVDLLLPDLPGEWSTSLINHNRIDRLGFLKSADAIWLLLDGLQLLNPHTRQLALHRTSLLMQRLATFLAPSIPPVLLIISRFDSGLPGPGVMASLDAEAVRLGINMTAVHVASFSENEKIAAGTGIASVILGSLGRRLAEDSAFWPDKTRSAGKRIALNFRNQRTPQ